MKPTKVKETKKPLEQPLDGNKKAFAGLLRQAVPSEADPPEDETSDPAPS